jgi:hypothetical protein
MKNVFLGVCIFVSAILVCSTIYFVSQNDIKSKVVSPEIGRYELHASNSTRQDVIIDTVTGDIYHYDFKVKKYVKIQSIK